MPPPWPIYINPTAQRCSERKTWKNQGRDRNRIGLLELRSLAGLYKHRIPTTPIGHQHSRNWPPSSQQAASLRSTRTRRSRCGLHCGSERALHPRPAWHKTHQHRIKSASMSCMSSNLTIANLCARTVLSSAVSAEIFFAPAATRLAYGTVRVGDRVDASRIFVVISVGGAGAVERAALCSAEDQLSDMYQLSHVWPRQRDQNLIGSQAQPQSISSHGECATGVSSVHEQFSELQVTIRLSPAIRIV